MGQLETLAADHHGQASQEWSEALSKIAYADEGEGEGFTAEEIARAAVAQHARLWWQQVMDLIHGDELVGAEAILQTRHRAEQHLIRSQPVCYGDLFAQAMA